MIFDLKYIFVCFPYSIFLTIFLISSRFSDVEHQHLIFSSTLLIIRIFIIFIILFVLYHEIIEIHIHSLFFTIFVTLQLTTVQAKYYIVFHVHLGVEFVTTTFLTEYATANQTYILYWLGC